MIKIYCKCSPNSTDFPLSVIFIVWLRQDLYFFTLTAGLEGKFKKYTTKKVVKVALCENLFFFLQYRKVTFVEDWLTNCYVYTSITRSNHMVHIWPLHCIKEYPLLSGLCLQIWNNFSHTLMCTRTHTLTHTDTQTQTNTRSHTHILTQIQVINQQQFSQLYASKYVSCMYCTWKLFTTTFHVVALFE